MAKKVTMKEKVLQYVEQRGSARYTDIIKFIVDTKFGANTYDNAKGKDGCYRYNAKGNNTYYGANPYRGYYSCAFSGGCTWKHGQREYQPGYFLKGADRLEKRDTLYYTVRTSTPKAPKNVQQKVKREYPRFTNKTLKVIAALHGILQRRDKDEYSTKSAFLREIEVLKFPHLAQNSWGKMRNRNIYAGTQYNSILNLCVKLGWIKIERKDNRSYKVIIMKIDDLPTELKIVETFSPSNIEMKKAAQILQNSVYGALGSEDTSGQFQESKIKMIEKMTDIKAVLHDNLSVNIALDPSLNWIVKTIDGKSYLSIKN